MHQLRRQSANYGRTRPCETCGRTIRGNREVSREYDNGTRYDRGPHTAENCARRAAENAQRQAEYLAAEARKAAELRKVEVFQRYGRRIKAAFDAGNLTGEEAGALVTSAWNRLFDPTSKENQS